MQKEILTSNLSPISCTHTTLAIPVSCYFPGTASTVLVLVGVIVAGNGITVMTVKVVAG